ncbi:alpha,alpha-trehalose-phosphate synthase (UDP-forming) [Acuticoccus mangrovi]|uniref:Trehalose-6-phosphate synthase n=1 Tax=Acuticoccus mangrovi TaxID=2796142 RepID=A0A934ISK2_9HYPH|nr:trehalose-6-phosphate synthase [Acuticoccus mangrovi]MBJ3777427.1 trehalose-6-phosphate synthase [Acuticoccus mangrovi]
MLGVENSLFVEAIPAVRPARHQKVEIEGRLIAVSNRVARPSEGVSPGGLASALSDALTAQGGTWLGWSGKTIADGTEPDVTATTVDDVVYSLLDLPADDYRGFYEGYANAFLWPVFHGRSDLAVHRPAEFRAYAAVNRAYAEATARIAGPDDLVWVHDYHFLLLGKMLREAGVGSTLGLFLHIPVPEPAAFRAVPEARRLAEALMHFDTIGVQTARDAARLAEAVAGLGEGVVLNRPGVIEVRAFGERVRIKALPIGIDVGALRGELYAPTPPEVRAYLDGLGGRRAILGVDRLDYSKGLPEKLAAFGAFLAADPARADEVVLTQIAPISRGSVSAYAHLRQEVEALAGRINGEFGSLSRHPLQLLTRPYGRRAVAHLMAHADVGLVTPLADGMNLVAKEFVAAQDVDDPGVLVLSRFAGAAEAMEAALVVDPRDADGLASAIERALAMPLRERRERHRALIASVARDDVGHWTTQCLEELIAAG